ncbi:MAG: hypothetical protein KIT84_35995 [Labilithrix sp.]|nr:hypothetical protein [Labilithrix sp.]MCW5816456.1 hypothetical protein [Labilithrix sp.]
MLNRGLATAIVTMLGLARAPGGCGGVDDPDGGPNAPCTRSSDCGGDLVCSEGVCREIDAGSPAPPIPDASDG